MNERTAPAHRLGPTLLLSIGILGISTATLWAKQSDAGASELAFRRLILTVPILWLISRGRGTTNPPFARGRAPVFWSGVCLAIHFSAYFASLERLPAAVSLVFVSMHPVLLLFIEGARRVVKFDARRVVGVLLSIAGSVWLGREELLREGGSVSGILLGLLSALAMVGYLLAGRSANLLLPAQVYARRSYGVAACWLGIGLFSSGRSLVPESANEWRIAALLAIFPTVLGHTPMNAALRHLPATVVSTAFLGEVVGASILVWIFLDEVPPEGFWLGGAAIALGILLVTLGGRTRPKE